MQAILIIDMCGFSRLMEEQGVDVALEAVAMLQEVAQGCTESMGGRVVKFWADNVMALFPDVCSAVRAAEATEALVRCAAGVGFGEVLERPGDAFGVEVNNACRLGEDIAEGGEVLLTEAAKEQFGVETDSSRPDARPSRGQEAD